MTLPTARPRWSTSTKLFVSALLTLFALYLLSSFRVVIPPLVLAAILAYVISPLVNGLQSRLHLSRGLATLMAYVVVLAILAVIPALFVPPLVNQLTMLNLDFQQIILDVEGFLGQRVVIGPLTIDGVQLVEQAVAAMQAVLEPLFGQTLGIAVEVITSFAWVVFIIVISFYLVKDSEQLMAWAERIPPPAYRGDFRRLKAEINAIWSAFFRGQLTLAATVAVIFTIAGFILGLPFTLALAVLAGLLEFVPSVGHGIWLTIASILVFFQGSTWIPLPNWLVMVILISLHLVFQQVDLNYLIPRIIGRRVHLHPLVIILGIVAGAALAGVLGVVLAAPTIASLRVLSRYLLACLFDQDPFGSATEPRLADYDENQQPAQAA